MKRLIRWSATICTIAWLSCPGLTWAAQVRVFLDEPLQPALGAIASAFARETGHIAEIVVAPSPVLMQRLQRGEAGGVAIMQTEFIERLGREAKLAGTVRSALVRVGFGLAVRTGVPVPPVRDADELKSSALAADALMFNDRSSGDHFARILERMGIADVVRAKVQRTSPQDVFRRLLEGTGRDIGVGTIPQIRATPGLTLAGPLPADLQSYLVYAAATLATADDPKAAAAFLEYLITASARAAFVASGAE